MNNDFNIQMGLSSDTSKPMNNIADVISNNSGTNPSPRIIKIEELEVGEYFQGLIYVKKSSYRKNKYKEGYDLRMYCVDGDGNIFTATCFNVESKFIVENKIVFVERGMKVESFNGGIFYNIERLMVYGGNDIPITAFLKEIVNKEEYLKAYEEMISRLENENPAYAKLIMEINKILSYKEILTVSPYKQLLGNKLGSALRVMMETIHAYTTVNSLIQSRTKEEVELFSIITLIYFIQPTIESYNMFHGTAFDSDTEDLTLPIEPYLMNLIYSSTLTKEEKTKILSVLMNREQFDRGIKVKGKFPMETMFFSILEVIETSIKEEEQR